MTSKYRPEIDGLRALAVIPVVLFHLGFSWVSGGFLGVDVFFVISGFLITSILIKEHEAGVFQYSEFWLRRLRRIFPALVVMLVFTSLAGNAILAGFDTRALGQTGLAALLSVSNIMLWKTTGGYWAEKAESFPMLHTWSLSVEEQFYFIFPFFLALVFRLARTWIVWVTAAMALISFSGYIYGFGAHNEATFYLLPTRAWELASGCLLSMVQWRYSWKPKRNRFLALVGLVAIGTSYHFLSGQNAFAGNLTLVVAGSILVLAFATDPQGLAYRFLAARPMVYIGRLSYSLYLWHWPILVLIRLYYSNRGGKPSNWILIPLITAAAVASYHLVERTTRQRENIVKPALAAFSISFAISWFLIVRERSVDMSVYSPVVWNGLQFDVTPIQHQWSGEVKTRMAGIQAPARDPLYQNAYKTAGILKEYGTNGVEIVVLGDSHALMWASVLDEIARELKISISFFTADGMNPFTKMPPEKKKKSANWDSEDRFLFEKVRLERMKQWKLKVVLVLTRWAERDEEETRDLFKFLEENCFQVLTIEQPPELFFGDRNAPRHLAIMGLSPKLGIDQSIRIGNKEKHELGMKLIARLEEIHPSFHRIKAADLFRAEDDRVLVLEGNHVLYIDDDHLSQDGALKAKDRIKSAINFWLSLKRVDSKKPDDLNRLTIPARFGSEKGLNDYGALGGAEIPAE